MQIHLLISYIESLRLSVNTWLALILAWYSSRTPQVTEVNCSPRADSQLSYSDCFFPVAYTWLSAEVPSLMQDSNSWATFKMFIENNRLVRPVGRWKYPDRLWIHNLGLLVLCWDIACWKWSQLTLGLCWTTFAPSRPWRHVSCY